MLEEILVRKEKTYLAQNGLYNLNRHETPRATCDNDNGIYYLAVYLILKRELGLLTAKDKQQAKAAIHAIQSTERGVWLRDQNRYKDASSHDNDLGVFAICAVINDGEYCKDWVLHGLKTGYAKDARDTKSRNIRWNRQGNLVAMMKLGSKEYYPSPWEIAWLFGSCLFTVFTIKKNHGSDLILEWVRCKAIKFISEQTTDPDVKKLTKRFSLVALLFEISTFRRWSIGAAFMNYFHQDSDSPIRLAAAELALQKKL